MDAPRYFAGDGLNSAFGSDNIHGVPGFEDAKHDIVLAIMSWVENGTAPDTLVATKYKDDDATEGVQRQRINSLPVSACCAVYRVWKLQLYCFVRMSYGVALIRDPATNSSATVIVNPR
ncbi:hypothetical protein ASPWEDRAFT_647054 [Aspergillus wentii DTO 134E9]|uniref:Carboxylic ester hydrolase n=1 Tax=Aspergillus wentii DTO 134E9 TaxID=1073089 RepID=A0A1L9RAX1_ASPWE|nr:uncharacterized protein ASPWEDRAFT_647054 [Aspergillus wentii DTO 134E9]OJJ32050.1 hypothetical protein ASPWEDRAFT_647054 [Aspergillus wentii DTO 134E9]